MQDVHIYQIMLSLHEQLRHQQVIANEGVLLVHAMKQTLVEIHPDFDQRFQKHYRALADGPLGELHAAKVREHDDLIEELRRLSQPV
jgi:hypothetical protein